MSQIKEIDLVNKIISYGGFFSDYIKYASSLTDAPKIMHLWVAIGTITGIIGKRVWYQSRGDRKYPNVYILIMAPSGLYGKSTAIDIGRSLASEISPNNVLPNEFSKMKLRDLLSNQPYGIFYIDEHSHLYNQFAYTYMEDRKELFCDLWDNRTVNYLFVKHTGTISDPSISIISGTTAHLLVDRVKLSDIVDRCWGRYLFIHAQIKEPLPADDTVKNVLQREPLKQYLTMVAGLTGEVDFNLVQDDMHKWITTYDQQNEKDQDLATFHCRAGEHLKKLSIICQVSLSPVCTDGKLIIGKDAVDMATLLCEWHRRELTRIFEKDIAFTWIDSNKKKIIDMLTAAGGSMEHSQLLQRSHLSAKQLKEVLEPMVVAEEIEKTQVESTGLKKKTVWRNKQ